MGATAISLRGIVSPRGTTNPADTSGCVHVAKNLIKRNQTWQLSPGLAAPSGTFSSHTRPLAITSYLTTGDADAVARVGQVVDATQTRIHFEIDNVSSPAIISQTSILTNTGTTFTITHGVPLKQFRAKLLFGTGISAAGGWTADGLWQYNTGADGTSAYTRKCGLAAPSSGVTAAAGAAGIMSGTYKYKVTFVHSDGHETNPNTTATSITVTSTHVSLTAIPTGGSTVTARRLYRTVANGELFLYLATISDNTTTTYDDNGYDTALGAEAETNNDTPPTSVAAIGVHNNRVWLLDGSDYLTLRPCKASTSTSDPNVDSFPLAWAFKVGTGGGDRGVDMFSLGGNLYLATKQKLFKISGDPRTGLRSESALNEGLHSPGSFCMVPGGVVFLTTQSKLYFWNGSDEPKDLGANFQTLLTTITPTVGATLLHDTLYNEIRIIPRYNYSDSTYARGHFIFSMNDGSFGHSTNNTTYATFISTGVCWGSSETTTPYSQLKSESGYLRGADYTDSEYVPTDTTLTFHVQGKYARTYFQRIGVIVGTVPFYTSIPPMLKLSATAYTGQTYSRLVDISTLLTKSQATSASTATGSRITVYLPIYNHLDGLTATIQPVASSSNKAAVVNGLTIYDVFIESTDEILVQQEDQAAMR